MEFKAYVGNDIPPSLKALTLSTGLMQYWLMDRHDITAVVAYENGIHVGWCAYRTVERNIVEVGTFVLPEYRKLELAKRLLNGAMFILASEMPMAQVRYGGSLYLQYNDTYLRTIKAHGLEPIRWW